ncbi:MAG TPA: PPE family protein [Mycobacterium sp.]|nr:PPE family protein [Mycobacterium sp.]
MTAAMDFAGLPPEVNSARMYAGAGSAPLLAAASGWDHVAAQLGSAADECQAVLTELADGPWRGPAAAAMTASARPYLEWMRHTAAQAEQTANQTRSAAAAYQQAFAAMVPPSAVAANRTALTSLVATNVVGQNTAAIAANQAEYERMWAQDAAVMHSYAASSAAAAALPRFAPPPQTTDPAGGQEAADAQNAVAPAQSGLESWLNSNPLEQFLNGPLIQGLEQMNQKVSGLFSITGAQGLGTAGVLLGGPDFPVQGAVAAAQAYAAVMAGTPQLASSMLGGAPALATANAAAPGVATSVTTATTTAAAPAAVSAEWGRATPIGGLSAPPSWAGTPQGVRLAATALSIPGSAGLAALPEAGIAVPGGWAGGVPAMGGVVNAPRYTEPATRTGAGAATARTAPNAGDSQTRSAFTAGAASSERDELNRVREAVAELRKTHAALKRSAVAMIREARQQ